MTALIIIGCIVLFLVLLFVIPAYVTISLHDELALTVRVFGIPIRILPKKQKKYNLKKYTLKKIRKREAKEEKKRLKKEAAQAKKAAEKATRKRQQKAEKAKLTKEEKKAKRQERPPLPDTISLVGHVAKLFFSRFFGKLRIRVMQLHVTVGSDNAASTAIQYGLIQQSANLLLAGLKKYCRLKDLSRADISLVPDFTADKIKAECDITFGMSIGNVLGAALKAGFSFLFGWAKIKSKPRQSSVAAVPKPAIPKPPVPPSPFKKKKSPEDNGLASQAPPSKKSST